MQAPVCCAACPHQHPSPFVSQCQGQSYLGSQCRLLSWQLWYGRVSHALDLIDAQVPAAHVCMAQRLLMSWTQQQHDVHSACMVWTCCRCGRLWIRCSIRYWVGERCQASVRPSTTVCKKACGATCGGCLDSLSRDQQAASLHVG